MVPYLIVLFIILVLPPFLRVFFRIPEKSLRIILTIIPFLCIFVLLAFKSESVGLDSPQYANQYEAIGGKSLSEIFSIKNEFGFYGLMKIFASLKSPFYFFQIFYYLFVVSAFAFFSYKFLSFPEIGAMVFYCFDLFSFSASAMRQIGGTALITIAVSILFGRNKHRFFWFYLLVVLAFTFHHSSIIAVFIPLVVLLPIRRETYYFFIIPLFVSSMFLFPYFYEKLYLFALSNGLYGGYSFQITNFPRMSLILLVIFFFFAFFSPGSNEIQRLNRFFYRILPLKKGEVALTYTASPSMSLYYESLSLVLLSSFLMLTTIVTSVANRLSFYFLFFQCIPESCFVSSFQNKTMRRFWYLFMEVSFLIIFVYTFLVKDELGEIPYAFFF